MKEKYDIWYWILATKGTKHIKKYLFGAFNTLSEAETAKSKMRLYHKQILTLNTVDHNKATSIIKNMGLLY